MDVERRVVHVLDDPDPAARRYRREQQVGDEAVIDGPNGTSLAVADVLPAS